MSNGDKRLYLYKDTIDLVITTTSLSVDNRPMNNRNLKAHKGVNNEIFFNIRNRDRKLQNVFSETLHAYLISPTDRRRVVTRVLEHTSDVGIVKLTLSEADLASLNPGRYYVYITRGDSETLDTPVYTDQDNNVKFDIEITDQVAVHPIATQVSESFLQTGNVDMGDAADSFVSGSLYGNLERNFTNAQHTMAWYPNAYTGQVIVQASCVTSTPDTDDASKDWFNVSTHDLSNTSSIVNTTFNVNCNWIRILHYPTSGTITKLQLRN